MSNTETANISAQITEAAAAAKKVVFIERAKKIGRTGLKIVGYTAGAAVVGGLGYLAYTALKGAGAESVAEAVGGAAEAVTDAAVETVAAALRG